MDKIKEQNDQHVSYIIVVTFLYTDFREWLAGRQVPKSYRNPIKTTFGSASHRLKGEV